VAARLYLAWLGDRVYRAFLVLSILYAIGLIVSRACGFVTGWFAPISLVVVPAGAIVLGLLLARRPRTLDAARQVDRASGEKDLFLTLTLLNDSEGEYKPLVARSAEAKADKVKPKHVVPFQWERRTVRSGLAFAALAAAVLWLPQFDPFGKVQAAQESESQLRKLLDSKKASEVRIAQLKKESDSEESEESKEVKAAIEALKATLQKVRPQQTKKNSDMLGENQKVIAGMWNRINAEKLKDLLSKSAQAQQFGGKDQEKLEKWTKELQEGSSAGLTKELNEMQDELKMLSQTKDAVKKSEIEQKLRKKLKELEELSKDRVNSKPLSAALERAKKALDASKMDGLDTEGLEAVSKALELTKLELKEIAQSAKDLEALEESLKVIQMAKKLNDAEKLDGEVGSEAMGIEDYEELYAELMAQMRGQGEGEGDGEGEGEGEGGGPLGGEGFGEGGAAPEDETTKTGFKAEQSKSAVTAGKILLSLKSKGVSDSGDVKRDYSKLVRDVKKGVSEAIEHEQIPPGYHDSIKSYFDTLDKNKAAPADAPSQAPDAPE
jgi:hypothetical protein